MPRYDFSWQNTYDLVEPKLMPAGTEIVCTARFDNSADNPANPDPTVAVTWGDQTWQEMVVGTMNVSSVEQDLSLGLRRSSSWAMASTKCEFSYKPTAKVEAVYLAGSFNDWKPDGQRMDGPDAEGRYTTQGPAQARRLSVQVRARRQILAGRSGQSRPCRQLSQQPAARRPDRSSLLLR